MADLRTVDLGPREGTRWRLHLDKGMRLEPIGPHGDMVEVQVVEDEHFREWRRLRQDIERAADPHSVPFIGRNGEIALTDIVAILYTNKDGDDDVRYEHYLVIVRPGLGTNEVTRDERVKVP